jgi:anti-anti-sigma factor
MTTTAHLEALGERAVIIRTQGEFDLATSRTLARALEEAAASGRDIVLDLAGATFLDVYCLRMVLATQERLNAAGRTVIVVNAPPVVRRLVDVLHIPDLIAV